MGLAAINGKKEYVKKAVERSLKNLKTDYIDLYYMHRDDETTPVEETLATMAQLIDSGKILHYGVSNFRAWRLARLVEAYGATAIDYAHVLLR